MTPVQAKLEEERRELLDLGLRNNRLINYVLLKSRGISIIGEMPKHVYRLLVENDKVMFFQPKPEEDNQLQFVEDAKVEDSSPHTDNKLQTDHPLKELQKRLLNTYYEARTAIEEQGVNTLYLALGMLQWYESEASDIPRYAPLILIPVELKRNSVQARFHIRYTGEEIGTNLSLQEKLKSDFNVELPPIPEADDREELNIQSYCQMVENAIGSIPRWSVDAAAIALGSFSFAKFLMYRDLDVVNWPDSLPSQHSVLQSILDEVGFQESENFLPDNAYIDQHLNPAETCHVVDADSSQALAIHDVNQGRNLLIQGPPGTGKSQTITNLIAEAIAKRKHVLFVAEKMAALEVVKRNLDKVGLGDTCLELHSHKANKKAVLEELKQTYELEEPQLSPTEQVLQSLISNRDDLNGYCEAVNKPIGESGVTPYQAYGELLTVNRRLSEVQFPTLPSHAFPRSATEFKAGLDRTEDLQYLLKKMGIPIKHSFWGSSRCNPVLPSEEVQVRKFAEEARQAVIGLKHSSGKLAEHLRLHPPDTCKHVSKVIESARYALEGPKLEHIAVKAEAWFTRHRELGAGLRTGQRLNQLYKDYENLLIEFHDNLIDDTWFQTVVDVRKALEALANSSAQLARHLKLQPPDNLEGVERGIRAAHYALDAPALGGILVNATEWATQREDLEAGLRAGEQLSQLHKEFDGNLIPKAWQPETWRQDIFEVRKVLAQYRPKWGFVRSRKYRRACNELKGLCRKRLPKTRQERIDIVDALFQAQQEQPYLKKIQKLGKQLFGRHWQCENSNWTQLQSIKHYLSELHLLVDRDELQEELVDYLAGGPNLKTLRRLVLTVEEDRKQYQTVVHLFEGGVQLPKSLEIQHGVVNTILEVTAIVHAIIDMQLNLEGIQELGKHFFDANWQVDTSNWTQLQIMLQYLLVLHQSTNTDDLPKKLIGHLASNPHFDTLRSIFGALKAQHRIVNATIEMKKIVDAIVEAERELGKFQDLGKQLFGSRWQGDSSNWTQLQRITQYLSALHHSVKKNDLPEELVDYLASNPNSEKLQMLVATADRHQEKHQHAIKTIIEKIELQQHASNQGILIHRTFAEQVQILERWEREPDKFQDIVLYNRQAQTLAGSGFAEIVKVAEQWPRANEFLSDLLKHAWYTRLIETAMQEHLILGNFDSTLGHQRTVNRFRELDRRSLKLNKDQVIYQHRKHLHQPSSGQFRVLMREFGKRRRHLPIRKLMNTAGDAIQKIKPVFMMSPLSVAKFLPPKKIHFDWVIFDEASQVKPVDAFGAILRGKQTVVVGDIRQLPPTRFFEKFDRDDDLVAAEEEENLAADQESILGLFRAKYAPERMLRWHYRSRHESLIAVSNLEFYDNKLQLFPSPDAAKKQVGLIYQHHPDTIYDRGKSRKNLEEARIVAEKVMEHARTRPHLTLGVATLSMAQMQAVQDKLEILRLQDTSCEDTFFNAQPEEPFFVKNLENVQGDERDVIFISIGYGREGNGGVPQMNFGPLNQEGGERRLNVLITRARQRCEVFTNLTADDIDLNRTNARGLVALKRYLKYAAAGEFDIPISTGDLPESPFEESVAVALRERGYEVYHQIGSAGYFVDLAIKDSEYPGRYLLGIECDGATYHSAQSARDRDRLRQQVLEGLGWRIHRIWSTDWFRNADRELRRVVEAIKAAEACRPRTSFHSPEADPEPHVVDKS